MAEPTTSIAADLQPVTAAVNRFVAAVMAQATIQLLELNLTFPQLRTLRIIEQRGRASGRQLARALQITPASVVPLCDRLEEQGHIERVRDRDDRRVWWFSLTPAGASLLDHRSANVRSRVQPVLAALSPSERENMARIFDTLAAAVAPDQPVPDPAVATE